jgi:hypothetical protein
MKNEHDLLEFASKALDEIDLFENKICIDSKSLSDGQLKLLLGKKKVKYLVEFKNNLTISHSQLLFIEKRKSNKPILLITNYVNPEMAERLRSNGIEFIDAVGNVFINQPPIYIFIKGNKAETLRNKNVTRAFKNSGLKIIFGFLTNPEMINLSYREIAKLTGVALGTVGWVMRDLKLLGFVKRVEKDSLRLKSKEELLTRWVTAYAEKLRPKQLLGNYTGSNDLLNNQEDYSEKFIFSGELAAARLINYLKPQKVTVFLEKNNLNDFLLKNRLKRDESGEVEILERFWNYEFNEVKENLVHPILVYADLIASGKQRNIETAKILYEKQIDRFIREN